MCVVGVQLDFSSDGKLLMTAGCDDGHTIVIWHWEAGEILATAKGHGSTVITAGFSPYPVEINTRKRNGC